LGFRRRALAALWKSCGLLTTTVEGQYPAYEKVIPPEEREGQVSVLVEGDQACAPRARRAL